MVIVKLELNVMSVGLSIVVGVMLVMFVRLVKGI